jgi:hypothetical protein
MDNFPDIFNDDAVFMINNAKFGEEVIAPKRKKQNNIEFEEDATISLKEVTDAVLQNKYKTKFKLSPTAKIYELNYIFGMTIETSSHPLQYASTTFYFGQTAHGFLFCGKGTIL